MERWSNSSSQINKSQKVQSWNLQGGRAFLICCIPQHTFMYVYVSKQMKERAQLSQ